MIPGDSNDERLTDVHTRNWYICKDTLPPARLSCVHSRMPYLVSEMHLTMHEYSSGASTAMVQSIPNFTYAFSNIV